MSGRHLLASIASLVIAAAVVATVLGAVAGGATW